MDLRHIRNFSIIAHIDHGKSTLADRMLEITATVEKRKMQDQVLDSMELERERGITIKMTPVRMIYEVNHTQTLNSKHEILNKSEIQNSKTYENLEFRDSNLGFEDSKQKFVLNLIDTPGHIDFSYEVSRALKAVEGAILLVDATQGVQAQTIMTLSLAREAGLSIIPVVSKIDSPFARISEVKKEIAVILSCSSEEVMEISGKTGQGVSELLSAIVAKIPPPRQEFPDGKKFRGLIFDFQYSNHTGVIVHTRVFDGEVAKGDKLLFCAAQKQFVPVEVGIFSPEMVSRESLKAGEIGYIVTGFKEPGIVSVGDTLVLAKNPLPALPGYFCPSPVAWASLYPKNHPFGQRNAGSDDWNLLRQAFLRLHLSDSSFTFEEESSGVLGRGFRCGFLGLLHLEIITERLKREFGLELIVTTPSIRYEVVDKRDKRGKRTAVYSPSLFPEHGIAEKIFEPWVKVKIITPPEYVGKLMQVLYEHEGVVKDATNFGDNRNNVEAEMPLRELIRNFFDDIKSVTSGFASLSYSILEYREANVTRMDILVADEIVPAFAKVVPLRRLETEAKESVERLFNALPRQLFTVKIQAKALGRILSSKTLSALRKDVTGYLYGGDITRKRKLWEQQRKGKKRLKERGFVNIPQDVFIKMMKSS